MNRCHVICSRLATAVITTALGIIACAQASAASPPNIYLDAETGGPFQTCSSPGIASFGNDMLGIFSETTASGAVENRLWYSFSRDSGATWTVGGQVLAPFTGVQWRWDRDSQTACDPTNGFYYVAGRINTTSAPLTNGIGFVRGGFLGAGPFFIAPIVVATIPPTSFVGLVALACSPSNHALHLLYTSSGALQYIRSTDLGATWSAPITLSNPADGQVMFPRLATVQAGAGTELHAIWVSARSNNSQPLHYRRSGDLGLTWDAEQIIANMRLNPVLPGAYDWSTANQQPPGLSMAVNSATTSSTYGRVAIAWCETWNLYNAPFPQLLTTPIRNEVEPNDAAGTALAMSSGDVLQGTMTDNNDQDWWRVSLAAGESILLWPDSLASGVGVYVSVVDPNGTSNIQTGPVGGAGAPATSWMSFTAPVTGSYYLRVVTRLGIASNSYYRIRTAFGTPGADEARDANDIAVIHSTPSGWSTPVRPALTPTGFNDYDPTIGFGSDGLDYVTWYDFSATGVPGAVSQFAIARNLAGPDPVVSLGQIVTDQTTDWNAINHFIPPGIGASNSVTADANRVALAWVDGRNTYQSAMGAVIATDASITSYPADTTVSAGGTVVLHAGERNRNPLFVEKTLIEKSFDSSSRARTWPGAADVARDSVPAGSSGLVSIPIAIPDTASAGDYPIPLTFRRQSGIAIGACSVTLHVHAVTGVSASPLAFRFDPVVPNPTRGATHVSFTLLADADTRVAVYGIAGNRIRVLASGRCTAGSHALTWDGRGDDGHPIAPGLYFVRLEVGGMALSRRLVLLN